MFRHFKSEFFLFTLMLIIFIGNSFAQTYNAEVEAKIEQKFIEDYIEITGNAFNKTEMSQSLHFKLSIIKNDAGENISKSDQTGRLVLEPGEKQFLSQTQLNVSDKDRIIVLLLLYNSEDQLMGKDRIVINGTEEDEMEEKNLVKRDLETVDQKHEGEDGVILRGIVIEETKTKSGRDFFKMFYSQYNSYNINGEQVVTVSEDFALANTTRIDIKVDNEVIFQFFVQPNNEFLKSASTESIKRLYSYLQRLKQNRNSIKQF